MTAQDLVDFIETFDLYDWELEAKFHGEVFSIVDAAKYEGRIRLYPDEDEE